MRGRGDIAVRRDEGRTFGDVRFGVLGPVAVWTATGAEVPVTERKVRALLAELLINAGRLVPADRLVDSLWGDHPPGNPANTLQTKVSQLRRALDRAEPGGRDLLTHRAAGYLLRVPAQALDAERFRALATGAREEVDARRRAVLLGEALTLWRGRAYADVADEPFAAPTVQRLEEERLSAVEDLAEARLELGEHAVLAGDLHGLVAEHPLRERLRGLQMRALYQAGRQGEALDAYARLRDLLAEELGVEPGPDLRELHQAILRQDPGLAAPGRLASGAVPPGGAAVPPAGRRHARPDTTNLPAPMTELVGRSGAVAEVRARLGLSRLVTLTGPGGVGKTRLALAVAAGLVDTRPGGVWLVELAGSERRAEAGRSDESERRTGPEGSAEVGGASESRRPGDDGTDDVVFAGAGRVPGPPAGAVADRTGPLSTADPALGLTADLTADERVVEVVADVLDIYQPAGAHPPAALPELADRVAEALRGAGVLLVLDNCEQVVGPVARLARRLLAATPELRILATSREPLGLAGEVLSPVPPLEVPDSPEAGENDAGQHVSAASVASGAPATAPDRPAPPSPAPAPHALTWNIDPAAGPAAPSTASPATAAEPWTAARVAEYSAVRLFVERAAATAPGFTVTDRNAAAVAEICRRLDGLPLALELAATRVRGLGVHELLDRLDDRFRLLSTGHRDAPARQRTLRAMIDWSWELLGGAERAVLRRLVVHTEGCTLAAAEAVGSGDGVPSGAVPDLLARLVDRSLVEVRDPGEREPRYRLLESVAAYCRERLAEAGEAERVAERHSAYYLALAERGAPALRGAAQRDWLRRLDAESANLGAAWEIAVRHGAVDRALRLVEALAWYWFLRGRHREALRRLRQTVDLPGVADQPGHATVAAWLDGLEVLLGARSGDLRPDLAERIADPVARARVWWFLGYVTTTFGDMVAGERYTDRALDEAVAAEDDWATAAALVDRASQALARGDLAAAGAAAERGAELFGRLGDRWGQVQAAFAVGTLAEIAGDYPRAAALFHDSVRHAEELGLWTEVSYHLSWLGRTALLTGDLARADALHERARRVAADQGFAPGEMYAVTGLALGARRRGDLDAAERHMGVVLDWHRESGLLAAATLPLAELGFVAELRGDAATALRRHREGYELARRGGDPRAVALAMEGLAGAYALAGEWERAARLLGAATAARGSVGAPLPPGERGDVDRIAADVRVALGEETFAAAFARGEREGVAAEE